MTAKLTDKQLRFVHEYLLDQNATAAAVRAGYSAKTRGAQATALMQNPLVRERIYLELRDLYASLGVATVKILKAQASAAYFDPAKLFGPDGKPHPLHELDQDTRMALTVSYNLRSDGRYTLYVRQTPRHLALAALEKGCERMLELETQALYALREEEGEEAEPELEQETTSAEAEAERDLDTIAEQIRADAMARAGITPALVPALVAAAPIPFRERAAKLLWGRAGTSGEQEQRAMRG
jgi:hypothetical protein